MPATEQTWRETKKLHFWFGITAIILLVSTIWMFVDDYTREWKAYTTTFNNVELKATAWREFQYAADTLSAERQRLEAKLKEIRGRGLDAKLLDAFQRWAAGEGTAGEQFLPVEGAPDFARFEELRESLRELAKESKSKAEALSDAEAAYDQANLGVEEIRNQLAEAQTAAAAARVAELEQVLATSEAELERAENELTTAQEDSLTADLAAQEPRDALVAFMQSVIDKATYNEDRASQTRKFRSAKLDAAVANLGIGVRDELGEAEMEQRQQIVDELKRQVSELTVAWENLKKQRVQLESLLSKMTEEEDAVLAAMEENEAGLESLARSQEALRVNFFEGPLPGKRWITLPIVEAFNSPLKIDNLWSEGLEQTYGSFGKVRRFDRCTSCHRGMEKTLPGSATDPAYIDQHLLKLVLNTDSPEDFVAEAATDATELQTQIASVSDVYGLHFASEGLTSDDDVTVAYVRDRSLASRAALVSSGDGKELGADIQADQLRLPKETQELLSGLRVGDVIAEINGGAISSLERLVARLADAVDSGTPLTLTVKRGLEQPFSTHPRLDLFVGSLSPHKVADFACTVCHDGQGSATEFKWASHTPNSTEQRKEWSREYGWFDNHHWIFPMQPKRFLESVCLKCHHDVTELRPSEQFTEAPAPKLMRGYDLMMKYGCYGCHEVNGYDGPKSIGPDLRTEPNFFAGALQLQSDPNFEKLSPELQQHVHELASHPDDTELRRNVLQSLKLQAATETPVLNPEMLTAAIDTLKDVESPGKLRKPGPSLRYLASKSDSSFVYDWINDPTNFRASTRMPKFFGHWDHLDEESKAVSKLLEPVEVASAAAYLMQFSQEHEYLTPPEGISPSTKEERIARGKIQFEERGCLACHSHGDFPDVAKYRAADQIQQGPDLSGIGSKFSADRNPDGRKWLYSWIKEPTRYHARTVMPNLYLEPMEVKQGEETIVVDPADDIVEYLLSTTNQQWEPAASPDFNSEEGGQALDALLREHLNDAFIASEVDDVLKYGVPQSRAEDLKVAEQALLVPDADVAAEKPLSVDQKLRYAGTKTIAKFGCYGCHDIPGFEEAKPIGAGLADWGRKDPSKLAFEHIHQYLHHGHHGHGGDHGDGDPLTREEAAAQVGNPYREGNEEHADEEYPSFYMDQVNAGNRIGFIYQKLREPRSYDYQKTRNKKYNDRLRMPLFPFDDGEREAVITFVLGLVADPPSAQYIYTPDERRDALVAGGKVLEKFNCKGCHMLEPQKWKLEFEPGSMGEQTAGTTFPFATPQFTPDEVIDSQEVNSRNFIEAHLYGMPRLLDQGPPRILDQGDPLEPDEEYDPAKLDYTFSLWKPALIEGAPYRPGETPKTFEAADIASRQPADGGDLARYLISRVGRRAREENPNTKVGEVWGWLPPPLHHEGEKVQTEWLHNFLLEPFTIRPATVLRMPKFNMSTEDATKLVNYFAAKSDVSYPYAYSTRRDPSRLERLDAEYRDAHGGEPGQRLRDAMKIVTSGSYCVKCHHVADALTSAAPRAQAPDLAKIYNRLRPDYLRQWIAKPNGVLPYTSMPMNVPYDPEKPFLGSTVPQDLYHGTSVEQVDALVDLLMNYDQYARQESKVAPLVKAAADQAAAKAAAAAAGGAE